MEIGELVFIPAMKQNILSLTFCPDPVPVIDQNNLEVTGCKQLSATLQFRSLKYFRVSQVLRVRLLTNN